MMTRGTKVRLVAFVILSAVGITYISASYLGFTDRILGRGLNVEATLPGSGGLFEGSMVAYRGVKIGKVGKINPTADGIRLRLELADGTKLPRDSKMYVHNLSAVGEQYLDFEPVSNSGPYVENGDLLEGDASSLPTDEGDLLVELDRFVGSVDHDALRTTVRELGRMFDDTGRPLQRLIDSGGQFVDTARANTDETVRLLRNGRRVLASQQQQGDNIVRFARDLRGFTDALRKSDRDLRTVVSTTPGLTREFEKLLTDLEPTLPVLLANVISVDQVMLAHMDGLEHLLVMFPYTIANGFGGIVDGWGQVNLQFAQDPTTCTEGYKPRADWRSTQDLTDGPIYPAECNSRDRNFRGFKWAPGGPRNPNPPRVGAYDLESGRTSLVDDSGQPVRLGQPNHSTAGDDAWKTLLVGPGSPE